MKPQQVISALIGMTLLCDTSVVLANQDFAVFCLPEPTGTTERFEAEKMDYSGPTHTVVLEMVSRHIESLLEADVAVSRLRVTCRAGADQRLASHKFRQMYRRQGGKVNPKEEDVQADLYASYLRANACAEAMRERIVDLFGARAIGDTTEKRHWIAGSLITAESSRGKQTDSANWSGCPEPNSGREVLIIVHTLPVIEGPSGAQGEHGVQGAVGVQGERGDRGQAGQDGSQVTMGAASSTLVSGPLKITSISAHVGLTDRRLEWCVSGGVAHSINEAMLGPVVRGFAGMPSVQILRAHPFVAVEALWLFPRENDPENTRLSAYLGKLGLIWELPFWRVINPRGLLAIDSGVASRSIRHLQGARALTDVSTRLLIGGSLAIGGEWR